MGRASPLVLAVLACTACGISGGASTTGLPVEAPDTSNVARDPSPTPREDPWAAFAAAILDASRALQAAALGNPYDEKWQCADPKTDIRSTDAREGKTLPSKGPPEYLLTVLEGITLTSPVDPASRVETPSDSDESEQRPKQNTRIVVRGTAFVMPDARVRWFELGARNSAYYTQSGDEAQTRLKRLPTELRGAMSDLVTTLTSSCMLSFADSADLAPLPLPQAKKESAMEQIEHQIAELPHACEAAARGAGPWDARVGRMMSAYRADGGLATLSAELRVEDGRLCISRGRADTL